MFARYVSDEYANNTQTVSRLLQVKIVLKILSKFSGLSKYIDLYL